MPLLTGPIMAAPEFDPDAYLREKTAPAFDPDKYLAEKQASSREFSGPMSGLMGAAQGATLGFGDEAEAGWKSLFGADYKQTREGLRAENAQANRQHPVAYGAGEVAGGIAPSLAATALTGGAASPLLAGRTALAVSAGQGAVQGAGYSDARDAGSLVGDTALGAGLGSAGHLLGELGTVAGKKVAGAAGQRLRAALGRAATQAQEEEAAKVATLAGKYGGELQKGSRIGENLDRFGTSLNPQEQAAADAIKTRVESGMLRNLPGQAGTIDASEQAMTAAQQALPQAVAARTAELSKPQFGKDAASFLKSYAEPLVAAAVVDQIGSAAGLDPRARGALDASAGVIFGRTRAGKALMSRLTRPGNQAAMFGAIEKGANSQLGDILRQLIARGAPVAATQQLVGQ
jgi:hypothetical protein